MPKIDEAIEALLDYEQADMEGVVVLASRQAIHEVTAELTRLRAELSSKSADVDRLNEAMRGATVVANIAGSRIKELESAAEADVRAAVIEECAGAADAIVKEWSDDSAHYAAEKNWHRANVSLNYKNGAEECAAAIRALGKHEGERSTDKDAT